MPGLAVFGPKPSDVELLGVEANLPQVQARRELEALRRTPGANPTAAQIYWLTLAATEDARAAERACNDLAHAQLRAGITPVLPE